MMYFLPNLGRKLTEEKVASLPKIGKGVDFDAKFAIIKTKGGFESKTGIKNYLYEPPYNKSEHFENVLRNDKPAQFTQPEFDVFMSWFECHYGPEICDGMSQEEFLTDKADVLFAKLDKRAREINWTQVDPVRSIQNLITQERETLFLQIDVKDEGNKRFTGPKKVRKRDDDSIVELTEDDGIIIQIEQNPLEHRRANNQPSLTDKPVLFAIAHHAGHKTSYGEIRAQIQPNIRTKERVDATSDKDLDENYWLCVSGNKDDDYIPMNSVKDHFFFLAVGNLGPNLNSYFPDGTNLENISTEELKYFYEKLKTVADGRDDIVYGIKHYVIT